jgi:hypothetical protein
MNEDLKSVAEAFGVDSESSKVDEAGYPSAQYYILDAPGFQVKAYVDRDHEGKFKSPFAMLIPKSGSSDYELWNDESSSAEGEFWWEKSDLQKAVKALEAKKVDFAAAKPNTQEINKVVALLKNVFNAHDVKAVKKQGVRESVDEAGTDAFWNAVLSAIGYYKGGESSYDRVWRTTVSRNNPKMTMMHLKTLEGQMRSSLAEIEKAKKEVGK